ncbi:MAG TPA: hypothetical protein VLG40_03850 [Candidatus Saccharimonas sp.]|nr:hypothetical protein [Candidatus Saccharimonas sp.]
MHPEMLRDELFGLLSSVSRFGIAQIGLCPDVSGDIAGFNCVLYAQEELWNELQTTPSHAYPTTVVELFRTIVGKLSVFNGEFSHRPNELVTLASLPEGNLNQLRCGELVIVPDSNYGSIMAQDNVTPALMSAIDGWGAVLNSYPQLVDGQPWVQFAVVPWQISSELTHAQLTRAVHLTQLGWNGRKCHNLNDFGAIVRRLREACELIDENGWFIN